MARKVLNRKELREQAETAERETSDKTTDKKKVEKSTKRTTTRKSRAKVPKEVRLKAYWGVFNQSLSAVVLFEYSQRKQAETKAKELSESRRSPHFVQLIKKVLEE